VSERYTVAITARAGRDLTRLPEKLATACVEFVSGPLADNPRRLGKPLHDELAGLHSARRGDYRVVYEIIEDSHRIDVVHIDRRSDVYR
jgi:mRNA-degrading endonuclease RelE of RelBE toxin-antitoxin system